MARVDKYGRGSAAANGEGFVDLAPGDTFAALESQLKRRIADRFDNSLLRISAMIGSKRNASELAKHLASGEEEEVHKFAAKNIGVLFARGKLGISHDDKKAIVGQRWITRFIRVFTPFWFAGDGYLATLTLKDVDPGRQIYAVEAVEINQDARSRSTPRGAISKDLNSAPFQDLTSQLIEIISYYVGDVNRTRPKFVGRDESFSVERAVAHLLEMASSAGRPCTQSTMKQSPVLSIIVPSYNMEKYLPKCLGSLVVAPELMDRLEVLVVNDGSKDRTSEIAHEFAAKWPGTFKVIDKENGHYGSCVNVGLSLATGEFVKVLDADDYFANEALVYFLQASIDIVSRGECIDLLVAGVDTVDPDGKVISTSCCDFPCEKAFCIDELVRTGCILPMHAIAYRRELLVKVGYKQTEGMLYTDGEWVSIPISNVRTIRYVNVVLYKYLVGRDGQSVSLYSKNVHMVTHLFNRVMRYYVDRRGDLPAAARTYMCRFLQSIALKIYKVYLLQRSQADINRELVPFDVDFKKYAPEAYDGIRGTRILVPLFGGIDYLRVWRIRRWLPSFVLSCVRIYDNWRR